jgi:hypothetical protein
MPDKMRYEPFARHCMPLVTTKRPIVTDEATQRAVRASVTTIIQVSATKRTNMRRAKTIPILLALLSPLLAMAATPPNLLSSELAPLGFFLGHWRCAGQFPNSAPIRSRETFAPTLNRHWLRMDHADDPPNRYAATAWWGYDLAARQFVVTVFDNSGGVRHYVAAGWQGDTLTLENTAQSGYVDRFSYQRLGDSAYRVSYAHKDTAGAWQPGDVLTCTRAPSTQRGADPSP